MESNSTSSQEHPQIPPPPCNPSTGEENPTTRIMPPNHLPAPPATEKRARRRTREVSSRYMIPASPAGSSSPIPSALPLPHLPLPKKHPKNQRRHPAAVPSSPDATDSESEHSTCFADENHSVSRSLETPLPVGTQCKAVGTQRRRVVRLFGDNAGEQFVEHLTKVADVKPNSRKPRPATPMVYAVDRNSANSNANSTPRTASLSQSFQQSMRRMTANGGRPELAATPARPSPISTEEDGGKEPSEISLDNSLADLSEAEMCSVSRQGGFCDSPPLPGSKARLVSDVRSSMPEADMLPTMSARRLGDGGSGRQEFSEDSLCRASTSLCHRSLNLALGKTVIRPSVMSRAHLSMIKTVGPCLPPQPPSTKAGTDSRKGRKVEDVHLLRLLHNQYLQWRFVNAKAQVWINAQTVAAEKSLYDATSKITELRNSVTTKRIELEQLKIAVATSAILDAQIPYLDEWDLLEGDHSSSLSGAIKALLDASLRVPIIGNVRADTFEIAEVLVSSTNMLESLSPSIRRFLEKAEGLENVISNLARIVSSERALIEECGDLLSKAHILQVKECSLRSHLIQVNQRSVA